MNRSQHRVRGRTPTAAVLLSGVGSPYQMGLLRGIEEAATAAGVSLLCLAGADLPLDSASGAAGHRVYDLCGPHNVDGVILLAGTLSHQVGAAGLALYCQRYAPLPVISIGVDFEGAAAITVDNHVGMYGAVCHLIESHGARRIAFVGGPHANVEAEIRLDAYRAALDRHGLAFDADLLLPGDFTIEGGDKAARELLKRFGDRLEGLDAVAVANDSMAISMLSVLEARGVDVPRRLAIVGFDDADEARLTRPPLTSVRQPLERVGRQAVRSFLDCVQFGEKPAPARLETDLIVRRSCGCGEFKAQLRAGRGTEQRLGVDAALMMRRPEILDGLTRVARGSFGAAGTDWQARLFNAVASDARQAESFTLGRVLQELMDKVSARGVDLSICDELLSTLRRRVLDSVGEPGEARERLEESFHCARLAISETLRRNLARGHLQLSSWSRTLSTACGAISSAFDSNELGSRIREELPRLGIQACFVVLYDDASNGVSRLLCGYDRRSGQHWDAGPRFSAKLPLPPELIQSCGRQSFVVMPLSREPRRLGHVLLELDVDHAVAYEPIAAAISTALCGAELAARARSASAPSSISTGLSLRPIGEA